VAEAGVPGYQFGIWFALFAPAGTPSTIVNRLNQELAKALAEPDMQKKLSATGVNAESSTPDALGKLLREEVAKWAKTIKAAGIPAS
jgi:tripartite-type tricarboxylate transporter receptor subunit TctC